MLKIVQYESFKHGVLNANLPFALNAQRWQYFLPCSVLALHVSQELE
jgi:hypothetical protein